MLTLAERVKLPGFMLLYRDAVESSTLHYRMYKYGHLEHESGDQRFKPLDVRRPVTLEVRFTTASGVDRCLRLPGVEPVDGVTLRYAARDVSEAFQLFHVMADLSELVPHI